MGFIKYGAPNQRITIHYHPKKTYGQHLLKSLLEDIGWSEADMKRLKLSSDRDATQENHGK